MVVGYLEDCEVVDSAASADIASGGELKLLALFNHNHHDDIDISVVSGHIRILAASHRSPPL